MSKTRSRDSASVDWDHLRRPRRDLLKYGAGTAMGAAVFGGTWALGVHKVFGSAAGAVNAAPAAAGALRSIGIVLNDEVRKDPVGYLVRITGESTESEIEGAVSEYVFEKYLLENDFSDVCSFDGLVELSHIWFAIENVPSSVGSSRARRGARRITISCIGALFGPEVIPFLEHYQDDEEVEDIVRVNVTCQHRT